MIEDSEMSKHQLGDYIEFYLYQKFELQEFYLQRVYGITNCGSIKSKTVTKLGFVDLQTFFTIYYEDTWEEVLYNRGKIQRILLSDMTMTKSLQFVNG